MHNTHPGITRMKALVRSLIWWPGIEADLELRVKACQVCQENSKPFPVTSLHPWEWPSRPWSRLHVDFARPFQGKMYLVLVDAQSKWLRNIFATHGFPEILASDNGLPSLTSKEFQTFAKMNGFRHMRSAPYHPSTNGQVERAVQTFKEAIP